MKSLQMLAIDLGASSGRGIVGSYDGGKLTLDEVHRFSNDPVTVCGTFRWDILRILHEIKTAIRAAGLSGFRPEGMGIDTWGVDFGLLDRHGELLANPVHYRDTRTVGIFDEVEGVLPAEYLYNLTGIQQIAFNSVYQLAAQKRDNPELLAAAEKMLFIPDLLNYFLTGKTANEYTITTTGALVNAATGKCAAELFDRLGIKHLIGELAPAGGLLGGLSDAVSAELGGTKLDVYHVASHDTASAVISVPATEPDFVYISSGTWSLMGTELTSPPDQRRNPPPQLHQRGRRAWHHPVSQKHYGALDRAGEPPAVETGGQGLFLCRPATHGGGGSALAVVYRPGQRPFRHAR